MSIQYSDDSYHFRRISISGRLDIAGTDAIATQFTALAASAPRRVIVDLTAVSFLASIGIRALITNAKALQQRLDLCLHEVLANIVLHGAGITQQSEIDVQFRLRRGDRTNGVEVTVSHRGPAFDPLGVELPPRPTALSEAEPGGLGLVMIRSFADDLSYQYIDDCNKLAFGVAWKEAGAFH